MTGTPVTRKADVLSKAAAVVRDLVWDASTEFQNLECVLGDIKVSDQKTFVGDMKCQLRYLKTAATITKAVKFAAIDMVERAQAIKDGEHGS